MQLLPVSAQQLAAMIQATDLITIEEKGTLMQHMPTFNDEERALLGKQIIGYERRKQEILKDAEEQKRKIEIEYFKKLKTLHQEQQRVVRDQIRRKNAEEHQEAESEADQLMQML